MCYKGHPGPKRCPFSAVPFFYQYSSAPRRDLPTSRAAFDGSVVANAALVPASSTGGVSTYASHLTHLILDINGYFAQ